MENKEKKKRVGTIIIKSILWVAGIWAAALIILQVALSPSILTGIVRRFADDYVNGDISFGKVSASVIKDFPNLSVTLDSVSLTYPHERFAHTFENGPEAILLRFGCAEAADTLASFDKFTASVNLFALATGRIAIPSIMLEHPRIFAKSYDKENANWNIVRIESESTSDEDTADVEVLPDITISKIALDDDPFIVFCNKQDTLFTALHMKEMEFKGKFSTVNTRKSRIHFSLDSLLIAGRKASDTLALQVDMVRIKEHASHYDLEAAAVTHMATKGFGRMRIPIEIDSHILFPEDSVPAVSLRKTTISIAGIVLNTEADFRYMTDSIYVKGIADISQCSIGELINSCGVNFFEEAANLETDAELSAKALFDGFYNLNGDGIPSIDITATIPESSVGYAGTNSTGTLSFDAAASGKPDGHLSLELKEMKFDSGAAGFSVSGTADDLLGNDPLFDVDARISASLDSLGRFIEADKGISTGGKLDAEIKGAVRKSQIDPYQFAEADLRGFVKSDKMFLRSIKDSIDISIDSLDVVLATTGNKYDKSVEQGCRMLALTASMDKIKADIKDALHVSGTNLSLKGQNDAKILDSKDSSSYYPFGGRFDALRLTVMDADSCAITLMKTANVFKISPKASNKKIPVLTLRSNNAAIEMKAKPNRVFIMNFKTQMTAAMNSIEREQRAKHFIDSLAKIYPDVPRDSLFRHVMKKKGRRTVPDWMSEKDFRKKDIDIRLNESLSKYFREWDLTGDVTIGNASVMTPYFPLRARIDNFNGHVTNNEISIGGVKAACGKSSLTATGKLSGLRGALLRRGPLDLTLSVNSDRINVNELIGAYMKGSETAIVTDTLENADITETPLIVIPANLKAKVNLEASDVTYANLHLDKVATHITMKERCVQLTDTYATSDIGSFNFEGFYSTRTKKNLKTGFELTLQDVTAEKVIEMIPAVDSIFPMLKSFKGKLNCEMAATASIDTSMNLIMPSINGVMRFGGKDLSIYESADLYKIAKMLKFKDTHNIHINNMSVEGIISNNKVEIFPFVLVLDRYTMAMSGIQNLDQSFRYHVSVLKSPLIFRFGVDLFGDFDNIKFKLGRAKYKNKKVPVFSEVVNETKLNLSNSIKNIFKKGVDEAIRENERQELIKKHIQKIEYTNAADMKIVEFTQMEQKKIEAAEAGDLSGAADIDDGDVGDEMEGEEKGAELQSNDSADYQDAEKAEQSQDIKTTI